MSYPGIAFVFMVSVAIGSAIYYYMHGDWRQQNQHHGHGYTNDDYFDYTSTNASRPTSPDSTKKRKKGTKYEECPICLQSMKDSVQALVCGHSYHSQCINKWLAAKNTCPICRSATNV